MFRTVLIANRGEIALRVARTCRELGIRTVAVHSTADRESAVVRFADEAVHIGPPSAKASYLHMPSVMEAALRTGADAIHPGYGFLSEDPDFAEVCEAHGVTFIGPPPHVIEKLGDKAEARRLMAEAGLPVLPGSIGAVNGLAEARKVADQIGYPLLLKAVAGGGGRGIAVVRAADELAQAYRETCAHARAVFGDDRLYVERFVEDARHIEVQVLCDRHGGAVHLGERDCSVQRRYQKLIEEAPAPNLPDELRTRMCEAAVRGALAVGYVGAATFEFVVSGDGSFHLMEVNCRLQVEHPVTEMSTGIDLVREQLLIAAGLPLSFRQEDLAPRGWSIESRVNAEDPDRDFAPTPGLLTEFMPPGGPFVRVDSHAYPGWLMGPDYDSLLAKTVVWAPDREQAIARMDRALGEFRVEGHGLRTTIGFLREILAHPSHRAGEHTTGFVGAMTAERQGAAMAEAGEG
ncbi:acetyl-CoA carboxylase biotin carboxylase subunit [Catenulispora sp. MAP12-49]|uniref:acetyl-CoA carboxylase biotin carboxylase subunit n=1 Tax=Catenulispora sp. MAP12-49 TaxID=3156302 RepID=UPI003515F6F4